MDPVFDRDLVAARRRRAIGAARPGADFLLRHAGMEIAERLAAVERRFPTAAVIDDHDGAVSSKLLASGRVEAVRSVAIEDTTTERLPLEQGSTDLIVSPLNLHLVNDTPGLLVQIRRALRPDGLFLAAVPGSGTLSELREALLAAEAAVSGGASPRVVPFGDVRDYGALLQRAGFALPVGDVDTLTVRYGTLFDLMFDLRAMGMTNPLVGRTRKPASRRFFETAAEIYRDRFADPDGRVRATFSMVNLSGWAPHESQQQPLRPGSATTRLAEALGVREKKLRR